MSQTLKYRTMFSIALVAAMTMAAGQSDPNPKALPATATTKPDAPAAATVQIDNFTFKPKELTIKAGDTVTWVNNDDIPHTATAEGDTPLFDSKALDTDDKYSFTFTQPGIYHYYCKVHPHMRGTIIVK